MNQEENEEIDIKKIINEKQLIRLIKSYPDVYYYDLSDEEIKSVFKAYGRILKDAIELGVKVPFPTVGDFYPSLHHYKGGVNNLSDPPTIIPPKTTRVIRFKPSNNFTNSINQEGLNE